MKTLKNEKNKIGVSELLCALYICNVVIVTTINELFNVFVGRTSIDTLACIGVFAVLGVMSLKYMCANIYVEDFAFVAAFIIVYCISYILFPSTHFYVYRDTAKILANTLLPYFMIKGIMDTDKFDRCFDYVSVISIACAALLLLLKNMSKTIISDEMNIAYSFILSAVYMLYRWLENKKEWWRLAVFATGVITLFLTGTRGPFLCIVTFVVMYLAINNRKPSTLLIFLSAVVVFAVLYYSGTLTRWFEMLKVVFERNGIHTRIIDMFLESDLTDDTTRSSIYTTVWKSIVGSPIYGNGILGDRVVTQGIYRYETGTYSHNAIIELMCHFGIVGGLALIVLVTYVFVKGYKCAKTSSEKGMLTVLISVSVTQLMVSFSYLFSFRIFLAIGYAVVLIQRQKYGKRKV